MGVSQDVIENMTKNLTDLEMYGKKKLTVGGGAKGTDLSNYGKEQNP